MLARIGCLQPFGLHQAIRLTLRERDEAGSKTRFDLARTRPTPVSAGQKIHLELRVSPSRGVTQMGSTVRNYDGGITSSPAQLVSPRSVDELQSILRDA